MGQLRAIGDVDGTRQLPCRLPKPGVPQVRVALVYREWRDVWTAARKTTGLAVGTHDLRHFTASALIAGGASVKQVQAVFRHSSAVITLRTYGHLWPGDDDRTRAIIGLDPRRPAD